MSEPWSTFHKYTVHHTYTGPGCAICGAVEMAPIHSEWLAAQHRLPVRTDNTLCVETEAAAIARVYTGVL